MCKKLFMLTSFLLVLGLVCPNAALGEVIEIPIAAESDDAEEDVGGGSGLEVDLDSSDLELNYDNDTSDPLDEQVVGLRFVDIPIPKGMNIVSAAVRFDADDVDDAEHVGDAYVIIEGELSPNPVTFEDTPANITARPRTAAQVAWGPAHWSEKHAKYHTPEIGGIIQEIVDQDDWASGNALVIIISQDPATASTGVLEAEAFKDNATEHIDRRPTLIVEFGEQPPYLDTDPNLAVWLKFDGDTSDSSGNGRDGTLMGEATLVEGGKMGGALSLDGDGDYVTLVGYKGINADRTDPDNPFQKPFSVLCWVNTTGNGSLVNWGSSDGTGVGGQYQNLRIDGGRLRAEHGNGRFRGAAMVNDGEWHHVAMTVAQGADLWPPGTQLYVDGVEDTEGADTVNAQNIWNLTEDADVGIGVRASHTDRFLAGMFDDVRIYDRELGAEEVRILLDLMQAYQPVPADGAMDADPGTLEWLAGPTAVSHKVYLSPDATIDEADLIAETEMTLVAISIEPGITYSWRVDEIDADGDVITGDVWTFSTTPLEAHFPDPADGAENVPLDAKLSWTPGKVVVMHDVYFGTDEALVAVGDMSVFKGKIMETSYDPGPLEKFTTYYWRVDEFTPTGTAVGPVWSFSTIAYLTINDDETVLNYDNRAEPFLSEVTIDVPADMADWTVKGLTDLTLRFQGLPKLEPEGNSTFDAATWAYTVTGAGADIWNVGEPEGNRRDEFHYVFRQLTGDGSITVRVTDNGTGSNAWAKGGVMIRQNVSGGSANVMGAITGGSGDGGTFQWREVQGGQSGSSRTLTGIAPPYWVRLTRVGNDFTCELSADGVTWELEGDNPHTVEMTDPVLIGLAVTSHQAGEARTFTFDNVSMVGHITGDKISMDIGGNTADSVYAAIEDAAGNVGVVAHPDPGATQLDAWTDWNIPLSEFAAQGVDSTAVAKLLVGVGDGTPGGIGNVRIDNIRLVIAPPPANLLANGGFEDGVVEPWSTYGNVTKEVVQDDPIEGAYCLHVVVPEAGANFWDAGLQHTGHVFEAGKNYTLSAWLKSSQGPLDINFKPELGADPWTGYGSQAFTMTEEWAEYSVTTGVFDADVSPATITFHIAYAPGDFYVDDVQFVEVE